MNSLVRKLIKHGELLGEGASRRAYLFKDRVYKIPHDAEWNQSDFEIHVFRHLDPKFHKFFPNPKFFGRIVALDPVNIAEDFFLRDEADNFFSFLDNFVAEKIPEQENEIKELIEELDRLGVAIDDIVDNESNFGLDEEGNFKIVDWGASYDEYAIW